MSPPLQLSAVVRLAMLSIIINHRNVKLSFKGLGFLAASQKALAKAAKSLSRKSGCGLSQTKYSDTYFQSANL